MTELSLNKSAALLLDKETASNFGCIINGIKLLMLGWGGGGRGERKILPINIFTHHHLPKPLFLGRSTVDEEYRKA